MPKKWIIEIFWLLFIGLSVITWCTSSDIMWKNNSFFQYFQLIPELIKKREKENSTNKKIFF